MDTLHQTPFGSFEWDSRKNDANIEKHGLDFVDVVLVFQDSYARIEYDPKHSEGEERYRITGSIKRMSGIHLAIPVFSKGYRQKQGKVVP